MGMPSLWVICALYVQNTLGFSALQTGLMTLPAAISGSVSSSFSGNYVLRCGNTLILCGLSLSTGGVLASTVVVWLHSQGYVSIWWLLLTFFCAGLGQGAVITPNQTLTLSEVPVRTAGSAGGVLQTGQRIGTALGIAVITATFFVVSGLWDAATGFIAAYAGIAVLMSAAALVCLNSMKDTKPAGL